MGTNDLEEIQAIFKQKAKGYEFHCILFRLSSVRDKKQLPMPKVSSIGFFYTASFFCRNEKDWFIYRQIYGLVRRVKKSELPDIFSTLEKGAYFQMMNHARTVNPLKFLSDIEIF